MATITPAAIGAAVAAEIPKIIRDGIEKELGGRPDFIANGTPESVVGQIGQAAGRSACRQYAAGQSGLTGQAAANAERVCRPYLDGLNPNGGVALAPKFQGGQCSGVSYVLTYSYNLILTNGQSKEPPDVATATISRPILDVRGAGTPEFQRIEVVRDNGIGVLKSGSCPAGCYRNIKVVSVVRADGQPDLCGNPPPVVTQPRTDPDPTPPPFRFNPSPKIDVPINVDINPDGTISVDIGTGPITVDAFNGDGGGGGPEGGGGGGAPAGDVGAPGIPVPTGVAGQANGTAPPGQVLTGIRVALTTFPPTRTLLENGVYRGAYYAYMGVPGLLDLDPAGAAATLDQFIYAEKDNLTAWRVRTNKGYNATVTPYYRIPT